MIVLLKFVWNLSYMFKMQVAYISPGYCVY